MVTFQIAADQTEARLRNGEASPPPVVRGLSIKLRATAPPDSTDALRAALDRATPARGGQPVAWTLNDVPDLPGWWDALPDAPPIPLGVAWDIIYALKALEWVEVAEPLLLISQRL